MAENAIALSFCPKNVRNKVRFKAKRSYLTRITPRSIMDCTHSSTAAMLVYRGV